MSSGTPACRWMPVHPPIVISLDLSRRRTPIATRVGDRPSGEAFCDLDDVLLRVAAVDAERVQFHQLAGVVLVDAAFCCCRRNGFLHLLDSLVELGVGNAKSLL